jgi:subtilisin-like proprotein convertase family protein
LRTCDWVNGNNSLNIPDDSPAGSGLALDDTLVVSSRACPVTQIEFVEERLTTRHEYTGDLNITLTSPLNRTSVLAEQRLCNDDVRTGDDCGAFSNWTFGSARHMNEPAAGRWTLSIRDGLAGKSGQLVAWSLRIHGR